MISDKNKQSAIVIGGTAGVGRAVTDTLLARGYRVGVIARGEDRLRSVGDTDGIETATADAADAAELEKAVKSLVKKLGKPVVWVNCAMATSFSPFHEMTAAEFDRIVATTFTGQVNGTRLALATMDRGHIVHVGSGLSYRPVPFQSAYCASKHAINGFVGAVRSEVLRGNRPIELSLVQLPAINTPQFDWARNRLDKMPQPAPPVFDPQVAADAVMQAIDKLQREVIVGRSVFQLLFGDMVLPAFIDRKLARDGKDMQKSDRPEPGDRPDNLFGPVDHPATARGSYSDIAENKGVIMDADQARKLLFFGGAATMFLLGVLVG
ncbi:SDR family oxidoreductase [Roseobacter sp.]|uniref:SDR family oxidoreductase n=1 Tax=Roseobacter sp. TaxID=1907202 RepID=UPI0025EACF80|nr:SDR family oxidoreductase [Roseobacter sp.]